jgi:hypothetical protein
LGEEVTLADLPYFVANSQHGEHCSGAPSRRLFTTKTTPLMVYLWCKIL